MTGVAVVTARQSDGTPVGFTANSFSSVSLDPPMLLVCPGRFLSSFDTFSTCTHFAVSVLGEGQQDVATIFARSKSDRFAQVAHTDDANGVPQIGGAIARFSCATHALIDAGDHCILLGAITGFDHAAGPGLGYAGGQFFTLSTERAALDYDTGPIVAGAIVQHKNSVVLERTATGLRPLQCALETRGAVIPHLQQTLHKAGVTADVAQAYSVFDDARSKTHYSYFLARARTVHPRADVAAVPITDLGSVEYSHPALATMMHRFAQEAQTQTFGLYFGDSEHGAVHAPKERM
ncbi:MAG: flavin reductase family protein [Pseudomonadota bacterium]